MSRLRKLYDMFLANGDLLEMFPELDHAGKVDAAGNPDELNFWERDKKKFSELKKEMENSASLLEVNNEEIAPDEYIY